MPYRARSRQFERRTRETFIWLAVIPALLFVAVYVSIRQFRGSVGAVIRSYQVLASLESLESSLKDAERGQRGYLLTGDESYLAPYRRASGEIDRNLDAVRVFTMANAAQRPRFEELRRLISAKMSEIERTVKLRRAGDMQAALAVVHSNVGEAYMSEIGSTIDRMHQIAMVKLAERQAERAQVENLLLIVSILAAIATLITLYWTWGQIHRYEHERNAAEEEVRTTNASLEQRIAERTTELARTVEDLRRSNKDLEHFAWVASHDLQEPLRNVSTMVQMLERKYEGQLDGEGREFIRLAVSGAKRMQSLVHDLLSYSRIGVHSLRPAEVDLNALVDGTLSHNAETIRNAGAVITRDDLPVVIADPVQIGVLFNNLLGNAIKFRGVQPPQIRVSVSRSQGEWLFSVCDNGIGFRQEYAERIFVIFQRLHGGNDFPGTGVGLAMTKRIVEAHGGRIWAESQEGVGSTFWFTLPAATADLKTTDLERTVA